VTTPEGQLCVGVLGLGEAGARFATDLAAAGAEVSGWDPVARPVLPGVTLVAEPGAVVARADLVLSLNHATVAVAAAGSVAAGMPPGSVFADLNTAAPELKRQVAGCLDRSPAAFADIGLLGPVPMRGVATPAIASGRGAAAYARMLEPFGGEVEVLGDDAGEAAERRLLRSVFIKGMAAAAIESVAAARVAGCEDWLRKKMASALVGADEDLLRRWLEGSPVHARRRVVEMAAAGEMLADLGTPSWVCEASKTWLEKLDRAGDRSARASEEA
jgi:3-hydroxyisobutyrate dehydrogenase-like beta-hydroxyacid dehydrogenase